MSDQASGTQVHDVLVLMNNLFDKINANWAGQGPDLKFPDAMTAALANAVEFGRLTELLVAAVVTKATPALLGTNRASAEGGRPEGGAAPRDLPSTSSHSQSSAPSYNQLMAIYKAGLHQGYKYATHLPS
jgi:hypothetical protein